MRRLLVLIAPVAIVEYEYKGITYKCVYSNGKLRHVSLPQDNDARQVESQLNLRKTACLVAIGVVLVLQLALIHYWPVTLVLMAVGLGGWLKFRNDLKKIQGSSAGVRQERLKGVSAEALMNGLK